MISGLILTDSEDEKCQIAFLGDETAVFSVESNQEIVEKIGEFDPEVLAVNSGTEERRDELTEDEEDLKEEGYSFTPTAHEKKKVRRLQALKAHIQQELGKPPEIIRFDPFITAEELAIGEDSDLESIGVETSNIDGARQFDAVLGAVTARFYQQDQFRDLGVIVPEPLNDQETEKEPKP